MTALPAGLQRTVEGIAREQRADGCIPWFRGHHMDPWNMIEAAMALDVGGRHDEAERAYAYLASIQRRDGWWHAYYRDEDAVDPTMDTNVSAYIAVGVWHHLLATDDWAFFDRMWPVVERAVDAILEVQRPGGEIGWSRYPEPGNVESNALVTCSSCTHLSLRCAIAAAEVLERERPDWEISAGALARAVAHRPHAFQNKDRWSMDWYYPVLGGCLHGEAAAERIDARWDEFVVEGLGVCCVNDQDWVTGAETCELAIALDAMGRTALAREVYGWIDHLRDDATGGYWTGATFPDRELYPQEQTTWSAGAVVLAYDALARETRTSGIFRGEGLPAGLEVDEPVGDRRDRR